MLTERTNEQPTKPISTSEARRTASVVDCSLDDLALEDDRVLDRSRNQSHVSTTIVADGLDVEDQTVLPNIRTTEDVHPKIKEYLERLVCLVLPTALLSAFCVAIVRIFDISTAGSEPFLSLLPFPKSSPEDTILVQILHANLNALSIMAIVVFLTYVFVMLFSFRMKKTMDGGVVLSFAVCWGIFTGYAMTYSSAIDYLTIIIVSLNVAAVGVYAVFFVAKDPWIVGNVYLIALGAILSWPFACLPELTVLFFLVWMAIWDIVAVCTPCGPLRYALYIQQQRIWLAEDEFVLPRGMVIRFRLYELGLGDLIFFGVVVARAASVDYETTLACVCSMLVSIIFTVQATVASNQTIPALPIAMVIGISVYVASRFTLGAFVQEGIVLQTTAI